MHNIDDTIRLHCKECPFYQDTLEEDSPCINSCLAGKNIRSNGEIYLGVKMDRGNSKQPKLEEYKEHMHLTKDKIAKALGITRPTLRKWENQWRTENLI